MFLAATATYFLALDGPLWLYLLLALAPDISMLAYLAGPGIGSRGYNAAHTYSAPLVLAGAGLWFSTPVAVLVALVWLAHIGVDRLFGYDLKYPTAFGDTHLGRAAVPPAPAAPAIDDGQVGE